MLCIASSDLDRIRAAERFIAGFEGDELQEGVGELLTGLRETIERVENTRASDEEREAAEAAHATDELEIDDDASVSRGDDGYWVSAWVWVSEPDEDDETCRTEECTNLVDLDGWDGYCAECADRKESTNG